jgi:hypothetical protein
VCRRARRATLRPARKISATQGAHLKAIARGDDPAVVVFDVWADVDEVPATLQSAVSYGMRPKTQADLDSLVASIVDRLAERLADEDFDSRIGELRSHVAGPCACPCTHKSDRVSRMCVCITAHTHTQLPSHTVINQRSAHILRPQPSSSPQQQQQKLPPPPTATLQPARRLVIIVTSRDD